MAFVNTSTGSLAVWARSVDFYPTLNVYDPDGILVGTDTNTNEAGYTLPGDSGSAGVNVPLNKSGSYLIQLSSSNGSYKNGTFSAYLMPGGDFKISWPGYVPAFAGGIVAITSSGVVAMSEDWGGHILFYDTIAETILTSYTSSGNMGGCIYSTGQDKVFQLAYDNIVSDIVLYEYDHTGSGVATHSLASASAMPSNTLIYDPDKERVMIVNNGTGASKLWAVWDLNTKTLLTKSLMTLNSGVGMQYGTYSSVNQTYYISQGSSGPILTVDANTYATASTGVVANSYPIKYIPETQRIVIGNNRFLDPNSNTVVANDTTHGTWYYQGSAYDPCSQRTIVGMANFNTNVGLFCYTITYTSSHFVPISNGSISNATAFDMCFMPTGSRIFLTYGDYTTNYVYSCKISIPTGSVTFVAPPVAPSSFAISSGSALLGWTDNSGGKNTFNIYKSTDGITFAFLTTASAGQTSYRDQNVTQSYNYWYKIEASSSVGTSSFTTASIYFACRAKDSTSGSIANDIGFYSPHEFQTASMRSVTTDMFGNPLTDSTSFPTYGQVTASFLSMSLASGSRVTLNTSSVLSMDNSVAMPILIIDDDGQKPVVLIHHGTHGNERDAAHGLVRFLYDYLNHSGSNKDPVFSFFEQHYTLIVVGFTNPYGWVAGTRRNSNVIDLNRNCQYGWYEDPDQETGTTWNSEENGRLMGWLYTGSYYNRILVSLDSHGWGAYGQWWIGYLVSNMWYTPTVMRAQRSHYLYYNNLLDQRVTANYYSSSGLTIRLSGSLGMRSCESRGNLKPYVNNNGLLWANPNCYRILIEHPQTFSAGTYPLVGSVGQPRAVNTITKYDAFYATLMCANDMYNMVSASVITYNDVPYMKPLNSNSFFQNWNAGAGRPDWTTYARVELTQTSSVEDGTFTVMHYPSFSLWPVATREPAYCFLTSSYGNYALIAGGEIADNPTAYSNNFYFENLDTGKQTLADNSDNYGKSAVFVTDNVSTVWKIGGYNNSLAQNGIYTCSILNILSGSVVWDQVATLPYGLQKHTAHYWQDPTSISASLIIAGGNSGSLTSVGWVEDIHMYRVDDNSYAYTLMNSQLATPRGWHVSSISGSTLFIFGGYDGTTRNGTLKVNLLTDVSSSGTTMPAVRRQAALAVDPNDSDIVWILFGTAAGLTNTGSNTIYTYDMGAGSWTTVNYTLGDSYSEMITQSAPQLISPAAVGYDDNVNIYVGSNPYTNSYSNETYVLNTLDNTLDIRNSAASSTYGYLKLANQDSNGGIFLNSVPGDVYTAVATVRRNQPKDGSTDPVLRLVFKSGPSGTNPLRTIFTQRFVPSDAWSTIALPFVVTASAETRMQAPYIRLYTKGTKIDIKSYQAFKGDIGMMSTTPDQAGTNAMTCSRAFTSSLVTGTQYDRTIRFEPFFGANSAVDKDLIYFTFATSSQLQYLTLHYTSSISQSLAPTTTDYATFYYPNPVGQFTLRGSGSGGRFTQSFLNNVELNYDNQQIAVGSYRRDSVSLKLETNTGSGLIAHMWFRGTYESASITTQSVSITGFSTTGSGMLLYADV